MAFHDPYDDEESADAALRLLREIMGSPARAAKQAAADDALINCLRAPEINLDDLRAALSSGANPDRIVWNGYPALQIAVLRQSMDAVKMLLRFDASTYDTNLRGARAVDEAIRINDHALIAFLRRKGADPAIDPDDAEWDDEPMISNYQTLMDRELFRAVRSGSADTLRGALLLGANPNAGDNHFTGGMTKKYYSALHHAIAYCNEEKVNILIGAGANVHARNGFGENALDILWQTYAEDIFSDPWHRIFDSLQKRGVQPLFLTSPKEYRVSDLRGAAPVRDADGMTMLQFLASRKKFDFIYGVLENDKNDCLHASDFRRAESGLYSKPSLIDILARQDAGNLDKLFNARVWQGRLAEMLLLAPDVKATHYGKAVTDFEKAVEDVRACRLETLRKIAHDRKIQPRKPGGSP